MVWYDLLNWFKFVEKMQRWNRVNPRGLRRLVQLKMQEWDKRVRRVRRVGRWGCEPRDQDLFISGEKSLGPTGGASAATAFFFCSAGPFRLSVSEAIRRFPALRPSPEMCLLNATGSGAAKRKEGKKKSTAECKLRASKSPGYYARRGEKNCAGDCRRKRRSSPS